MYLPEDIDTDEPKPEGGFDLIPDGPYEAKCIGAEEKPSSGGKPQMKLTWRITGPRYANRRIWDDLCFVDGRKRRSKEVCATFGIVLSAAAPLLPSAFIGKRAILTLITETYNGKTQNKVAFSGYAVLEAEGAPVVPEDGSIPEDDIPF